jgi:hypothetical protein
MAGGQANAQPACPVYQTTSRTSPALSLSPQLTHSRNGPFDVPGQPVGVGVPERATLG